MTPQVPNRTVFERALPREEMDDTTRALFDAALRVQEHAHAPYSNYHVGCSVLTSSGQIYVGANIENAAYPQGLCAEATALAVMASHGERQAQVVLTVCDSEGLATSCGGCRQKIREFATSETIIHACSRKGLWATYTMDGLLPDSFGPEHLSPA
ncbi:MAG: cytidine deaminase [Actinomycetota bacterium]|nr:cytidine deaminase [Actinomycetota bacterium]